MNKYIYAAISFLSDFFKTAGGAYTAAAVASSGQAIIPGKAEIIICCIAGLVQALGGLQKTFSPPPT